jgi:processive 1,2-diacylglycerol beta-glucosyltransferase
MVIVHPIPGQEERNADHLLEAGAAIRGNNLPALAWKVDALLDDAERLVAMRAAARRLAGRGRQEPWLRRLGEARGPAVEPRAPSTGPF